MRRVGWLSSLPRATLALAVLFILAVVALVAVTPWGIGLSPDSATYLAGARGLTKGHGFAFPYGGGRWHPITVWPPFYSIVLAFLSLTGFELPGIARLLGAVLLGGNTVVVVLLLRRLLGSDSSIPIVGGILFVVSADALAPHGWAWSDPLALVLGNLGLLLLDLHLETGRRKELVAAAILLGLSAYTRYIGVAYVLTGLLFLAGRAARSRRARGTLVDIIIFSALALMPLGGFMLRNLTLGVGPGGDISPRAEMGARDWEAVYRTVSLWFVPGRLPEDIRSAAMIILAVAFLVLSFLALWPKRDPRPLGTPRTGRVILVFVVVYFAFLIGAKMSLRAFPVKEPRFLLPVFASLIVLWLYDLSWLHERIRRWMQKSGDWWRSDRRVWVLQLGWAVVFFALLSFHGAQAAKWVKESVDEGLGYSNESWHSSPLVEYLRELPADTPVVSNAFDAVWVLTGKQAFPFPRRGPEAGIPTGLSVEEEWIQTKSLLQDRRLVVAAFNLATRGGQVRVDDLLEIGALCPLAAFDEGTVYGPCRAE